MKKIISIIWLVFLLNPLGHSLQAEVVYDAHVHAELISEVDFIQPGVPFGLALRMVMDDSWHTYWKNPGDSGLPTRINWNAPDGFQISDIDWPYPQKIEQPPLTSYGYTGEILLLVQVVPPQNLQEGDSIRIQASADWLACQISCIPGKGKFFIDLPVAANQISTQIDQRWRGKFLNARLRLPLRSVPWPLEASRQGREVELSLISGKEDLGGFSEVYFFGEQSDLLNHSAKQILKRFENGYRLILTRSVISSRDEQSLKGILFWAGNDGAAKAYEIDVPFQDGPAQGPRKQFSSTSRPEKIPLFTVFLFAFIGGLILNLMPCVLPILALKVLNLLEMSKKDKRKIWLYGVLFALGIVFCFWVLAGVLILLRTLDQQVGWGFQLQSRIFVTFLIFLFFTLSLNLTGFFEIGVFLSFKTTMRPKESNWITPFLSGILTTIVATPCTAPFMGSALGVALAQPSIISFLIFTSLGLGMAFPYLLLSFFPQWIVFVPKPGAWMVYLKQFFGFVLMGVVVWLLWVLGIQSGIHTIAMVLASLLLLTFAIWFFGTWAKVANLQGRSAVLYRVSILAMVGCGLLILFRMGEQKPTFFSLQEPSSSNQQTIQWNPYSEDFIKALRQQNKIVFLDFTAAWCLTCQVNEEVVFKNKEVIEKFKELSIVAVKADWTSRDPQITKALADFGRNSIPLYILFGKNPDQAPILLPEIITPRIVLDALENIQ